MVGIQVDKNAINTTGGDIARSLLRVMNRVAEFKRFLDRYSSAELVAQFGFAQAEADLLKSAFGDADIVRQSLVSNRTFLSQISGMGDV